MELLLSILLIVFLFALHLKPIPYKSKHEQIPNHDCSNCSTVLEIDSIRSLKRVKQAINLLSELMKNQVISDITEPKHQTTGDFQKLTVDGHWPKLIEHYFMCKKCKTKIRLLVNVYGPKGYETFNGQLERF